MILIPIVARSLFLQTHKWKASNLTHNPLPDQMHENLVHVKPV